MTTAPPAKPRLPRILGWIAFALVILFLGPIAYAVVSLSSNPGGSGADPAAKIFIALVVLALAAAAFFLVRGITALILRFLARP